MTADLRVQTDRNHRPRHSRSQVLATARMVQRRGRLMRLWLLGMRCPLQLSIRTGLSV